MSADAKNLSVKARRRGTLRDKFILAFLSVSTVPLLALGLIATHLVNSASQQSVSQLELQLLRQKKEEIERFFEEIRGVLDLRVSTARQQSIEQQGTVTVYDIAVAPAAQRRFLLEGILAESRAIEAVSLFDLQGKEIERLEREREAIPARELIDASRLDKFQRARNGERYLSPIHYTLRGLRTDASSPIRNAAGDVIGVASAQIDLKPIERLMARGVLGNTGYTLLVTDGGDLVAASLKDAADHPNLRGIPLIKAASAGALRTGLEEQNRYRSFWQERVVGAGLHLDNLPLALVAEWPEDDALSLARTILRQILTFLLFALLATILISALVARKVTEPIRLLEKEAQNIGTGRFDDTVAIKTNDEIQELDEALHEMAKGLKRLKELREEFVFIAAHELRAPVTAIKGYLAMLSEGEAGPLSGQAREFLTNMQQANEHLVQLVKDLLEVARSEAGRTRVEVSPQDLAGILRSVIADLKPLWEARNLRVTYRAPAQPPQVLADRDKLREVIVNLLSNAIKYNREGGTVEIWHDHDDASVATHVRDSGIGMDREELGHLFEKFWRAENAKARKAPGTGLGLYIVKEILAKMGGQIQAVSERGKGSTFSFTLPVAG